MHASYRWLRELTGIDASPIEVGDRLTAIGLTVDGTVERGHGLERVVVAEVRAASPHPKRDRLTVVRVFDGERELEVVCGAPNVPAPGGRVLFARIGASLPNGMQIAERALAGVTSHGMICSEIELAIGDDADGIVVVGDATAAPPGASAADALGLRDTIYDIGLTPNRPDCLGHIGIARDLTAAFGVPFRVPEPPPAKSEPGEVGVGVAIEHPDRCPRYGAGLVRGVTIGPSPLAIRHRLHCLGHRPIHNVVDATNYVLLEHGHPTHAFDLARVRGRRIVVRRALSGETMATLDGVSRTFTDDDLLICDGEGPVAVAGVMGGANSEIGEDTRDVLVECAYFDPRSVRRTSRRLALHTDASHRFERGVDPNGIPLVLRRTTQLVAALSGGTVVGDGTDVHPRPIAPAKVALRTARADALLGVATPPDTMRAILEAVGCEVEAKGDALVALVPTHRPDLRREVDLVEEIARIRGFDAIPTAVPAVRPSREGTPRSVRFARRAREAAAAAGLDETIHFSFVGRAELEAARAPSDLVVLDNPLGERAVMRTSLLPGLASAARHAERRQAPRVRFFEVGRTFHAAPSSELPRETRRLGILLAGARPSWIGDEGAFDLYDGKGAVVSVVSALAGAAPELAEGPSLDALAPWSHPRRRAVVHFGGVALGAVGELHPDVSAALELGWRAVFAELDLDALFVVAERTGVPKARPLPRFPHVARDIALVVDDALPAGTIAAAIRGAGGGLVADVQLFDLYRGAPIPEGKKSLAFRVIYRDSEATLTDAQVDQAHSKVLRAAADLGQTR